VCACFLKRPLRTARGRIALEKFKKNINVYTVEEAVRVTEQQPAAVAEHYNFPGAATLLPARE
jgi:hypothetical protein